MDRKQLFKHRTEGAKSLREKRRHDRQEAQKRKRDALLRGKRMRKNTLTSDSIEYTEEEVKELTRKLMSDTELKSELLKKIRRALSLGSALIDAFISVEGSLSRLVEILESDSDNSLQVEAAWCLNNISAGTNSQAAVVIELAGAALVKGLKSGVEELEDQCAWAVGNLAGGNTECRKSLKDIGVIEPLIELLKSPIPSVVHCAAFALSNLARDKEMTNVLMEFDVLPHLVSHLVYTDAKSADILAEICWLLTYISACGTHEKQVVDAGVLGKLITLVLEITDKDFDNVQVLTPLLRCLGNIICSGPELTGVEACQNKNLFQALDKLVHSEHQHVRKECVWVLSNVSTVDVACKEFMDSQLLESISSLLRATFDLKKEAAYTLCNIAAQGAEYCERLLELGSVLPSMISLLKTTDHETVHYALSFCELIMQHTAQGVKTFKELGGLDGMEGLEYNNDEVLRGHADNILDTYFYKEDSLTTLPNSETGEKDEVAAVVTEG